MRSAPPPTPMRRGSRSVSLQTGNYTLYCTVPGHKQAGMVAKLAIH